MYSILIVEDEKFQREALKKTLEQAMPSYNIFTAATSKEGYEICINYQIDLFILDIVLPDKSGLDLATEIRKHKRYEFTWIIFITDFSQYIVSAFKRTKCYDYILKPYKNETVIKVVKKLAEHKVFPIEKESNEYLVFKNQGILFKIYKNDILYIDVFNRACTIYTEDQNYKIKKMPLSKMLTRLSSDSFAQCHRSYIVNLKYLDKCEKLDIGWELSLLNGVYTIPLGESFKEKIFELLANSNL